MKKYWIFLCLLIFLFGVLEISSAEPIFYVNPGNNPIFDTTWQEAVGNSFDEFDLDNFYNGADVDLLTAGSLTIDIGLSDTTGTNTADTAEIFYGAYAGGVYGTVYEGALLNRDMSGKNIYSDITFTFSDPVYGAGAWIYDNGFSQDNSFLMIVTEVGGTTFTSSILESGNGLSHAVEGWLAATSSNGIEQISFRVLDGDDQPTIQSFELDHFQVAQVKSVPEPATMLLLGSLLIGFAGAEFRKKFTI